MPGRDRQERFSIWTKPLSYLFMSIFVYILMLGPKISYHEDVGVKIFELLLGYWQFVGGMLSTCVVYPLGTSIRNGDERQLKGNKSAMPYRALFTLAQVPTTWKLKLCIYRNPIPPPRNHTDTVWWWSLALEGVIVLRRKIHWMFLVCFVEIREFKIGFEWDLGLLRICWGANPPVLPSKSCKSATCFAGTSRKNPRMTEIYFQILDETWQNVWVS